ncbi:hypothetical protein IFM89_039496 [Coptis chinensis]|uniref:40S ribosomal protein S8 n=1 Tax=Coptis chinensis TaxID=261450 RepID=A0A835IX44_9MAGN|nr:hypothetical protein IFM89_039496 [Coptis chinensis]
MLNGGLSYWTLETSHEVVRLSLGRPIFLMWFTMPPTMSLSGLKLWKKKSTAKKEGAEEGEATVEGVKKTQHVLRKLDKCKEEQKLDSHIEEQLGGGRLLACISSHPSQCGRANGYILEGKELEFYMKKLQREKGKGSVGAA